MGNLSSIGAELAQGTGPIEALHAQETRLNALTGVALLHLRPGAFMGNLLPAAPAVAAAGVLPGMEAPDARIPMVATRDIAASQRSLGTGTHVQRLDPPNSTRWCSGCRGSASARLA